MNNEIWILADKYIAGKIAGDDIDMEDFCNNAALTDKERSQLRMRLMEYEASQKVLRNIVNRNVNSDRIWDKVQQRIAKDKVIKIEQNEPYKQDVKLAAKDSDSDEKLASRMKHEFQSKEIALNIYTGKLLYKDSNSANLVFRKGKNITTELDGNEIDLFAPDKEKITLEVKNGSVLINFAELGISIRDYAKTRYIIRKGNQTIAEGSLGDE